MNSRRVSLIGFATLLTLLACRAVVLGQPKSTAPETIITKMALRYSAMTSYEDFGVVEMVTDGPLPKRSTNIAFKTYFTRPNKFRFEWLDYASPVSTDKNVVWSDGAKAFAFYSYEDAVEPKENLSMAIAGASGVSLGAAYTVPNLLSAGDYGFPLTELTKLALKAEETVEGEECYLVEGYHPHGEAWHLWISKKDFLLRKLKTPSLKGEFKELIYRTIKVESRIPEALYQIKVVKGRIVEEIAKEKEADIRRLLELIYPRDRINQEIDELIQVLKTLVPDVPEKTLKEVIAELRFDSSMVQQIYLPIYDWHYTEDDIKQILAFYASPLGQKVLRSTGPMEAEAKQRGVRIGEEFMKRIQERLRAKGFKVARYDTSPRNRHACVG